MSRARRSAIEAGTACWLLAAAIALPACSQDAKASPRTPEHPAGTGGGNDGLGGNAAGTSAGAGSGSPLQPSPQLQPPPPPPPAPNVDQILKGRCATASMQSQLLPSNLLIVLDRSASMACNPPPITDSASCEANPVRRRPDLDSKWEITRSALERAIRKLPADTVIGLSYFSNNDSCGVHALPNVPLSPLDLRQLSALRASLDNVTPNGSTPLVGATVLAYQHLHRKALAGEIHGSKYVVLITDGEQSDICTDSERCEDAGDCTRVLLEEDVPRAASSGVGIKTFVIGAPGSESARTVLSAIAQQGGTAPDSCEVSKGDCHFDMTRQDRFDADALQETLTEIAGRALSCELPLPEPASGTVELERLNVIYSPPDGSPPQLIPQDFRKACNRGANGWQYAPGAAKILLCGQPCERALEERGGRLDVVLGCPVQVVQ